MKKAAYPDPLSISAWAAYNEVPVPYADEGGASQLTQATEKAEEAPRRFEAKRSLSKAFYVCDRQLLFEIAASRLKH